MSAQLGDLLPDDVVDGDPCVAAHLAFVHGMSGRHDRARQLAERAAQRLDELGQDPPSPGWRSTMSASCSCLVLFGLVDTTEELLTLAQRAVELETDPTVEGYGVARMGLAIALSGAGRFHEAAEMHVAIKRGTAALDPVTRLIAAGLHATAAFHSGDLDGAHRLVIASWPMLTALEAHVGDAAAPATMALHTISGELARRRGDLDAAVVALERAPELARVFQHASAAVSTLTALAGARMAAGDRGGARAALAEAHNIVDENAVVDATSHGWKPPRRRSAAARRARPAPAGCSSRSSPTASRPCCAPCRARSPARDRRRALPVAQHRQGLREVAAPHARVRDAGGGDRDRARPRPDLTRGGSSPGVVPGHPGTFHDAGTPIEGSWPCRATASGSVARCPRPCWRSFADGGTVSTRAPIPDHTALTCALQDEAALRGVLNMLWDAGFTSDAVTVTPRSSRRPQESVNQRYEVWDSTPPAWTSVALLLRGGHTSAMRLYETVPALPVRDISASAAFYRDRLGFHLRHHDGGFAIVGRDHVELHLWQANDTTWRQRSAWEQPVSSGAESFIAGTASCRIRVEGVEELFDELRTADVLHPVSKTGPSDTDFGTREFATLDLDGNLLTFFQVTAPPG